MSDFTVTVFEKLHFSEIFINDKKQSIYNALISAYTDNIINLPSVAYFLPKGDFFMRKLFLLPFLCLFILSACEPPAPPVDLLTEFVKAYGAEGTIYYSEAKEWDDGYLSPALASLAFGERELPRSYAILLNIHLDTATECGLFLIEGNKKELLELSIARASTLDPEGERTYIAIYGSYVFYSTLSDKDRAKRIADLTFK